MSTLVTCLNDASDGGQTVFPQLGSLAVSPVQGHACYFEYGDERGRSMRVCCTRARR